MGKKDFDYDTSREEVWQTRKQRVSRAEQTAHIARATAVAKQLVQRLPSEWGALPLEDGIHEQLVVHSSIRSKAKGARKRALSRLSSMLISTDLDALEDALASVRSPHEDAVEALVRWRTRIQEDPHAGLTGFLELYPEADRQRIRQATTQWRKVAGTEKAQRANRAMLDALKEASGLH